MTSIYDVREYKENIEEALEDNSGTKFHSISGVGTLDEVKTRINTALES